ncbi:DUF2920 family protein [Paenibacillus pabuli]|uniref:DUF2920 family protein n=1 Tax=Paenibacillus pabuli TaxID=1472 RepID=UPI0007805A12|nr:DUF2920 family protein [Paenibacillus pabuli]MEC0129062.1 DUF2920 family protein [Paenibacillus pabuli]
MAQSHKLQIEAHPSVYSYSSNRELHIEFSIPEQGVNSQTALMLIVPGFGADIDSKVYQKMRKIFADEYNLVTIQCSYFGSKFMQNNYQAKFADLPKLKQSMNVADWNAFVKNPDELPLILKDRILDVEMIANLGETIDHFNDMGYMQAIDIITAVEAVRLILNDNNLEYNRERLIGYGHSHGAYLLYLCNRLRPNFFSFLVDNSAWMHPLYLSHHRILSSKLAQLKIITIFDYMAGKVLPYPQDLHLNILYATYYQKISTQILSFIGEDDILVDPNEKSAWVSLFPNTEAIRVRQTDVDHIKYKSSGHGLNADFVELFRYAMTKEIIKSNDFTRDGLLEETFGHITFKVNYSGGLPVFSFNFSP